SCSQQKQSSRATISQLQTFAESPMLAINCKRTQIHWIEIILFFFLRQQKTNFIKQELHETLMISTAYHIQSNVTVEWVYVSFNFNTIVCVTKRSCCRYCPSMDVSSGPKIVRE